MIGDADDGTAVAVKADGDPADDGGEHAAARPRGGAFPIVGIGASAGGLEAFTQLLQALPASTGMAFVVIQHLDPTYPSSLREALAKATAMTVLQAEDGAVVEPDHVYVIPPEADIAIGDGRLTLVARPKDGRSTPHLPLDSFLQTLAAERGSQAIGVVLSGTASDGTEGLRAIKAADGITFAQDPLSAKFSGMPRSAIAAGVVDHCLEPRELADELVRLSQHPYVASQVLLPPDSDDATLKKILAVVRSRDGIDFAEYKRPTLERRLARRMAIRRVAALKSYLALLRADADEVHALYEDILIHVTSFFRDPEVYEVVKAQILSEILRRKPEGVPMRIWVAGCSTGEEVYSVAIALLELLGDSSRPVQIFGSDVSGKAIEKARAGVYPDGALRDMGEERRRRYFTRVDHGYRIVKSVRDLCVFVEHDLARDPPFSKLDLVSCRNVLIYFGAGLQERVLSQLHYALNEPGYLVLGRTENIAALGGLFSPVDRAHKIFARSMMPSTLRVARQSAAHRSGRPPIDRRAPAPSRPAMSLAQELDRLLLSRYAPPGVLVDGNMEILHFRGLTGAYLQPAPGTPHSNIVKMARGGLLATLRATMERAKKTNAPARAEGVEVDHDGATRTCDVVVIPLAGLPHGEEPVFAVLFEEPAAVTRTPARSQRRRDDGRVARLENELAATKDYLHTLIDEQGRSNDDLGSANEELISSNEELQSLNEELETAKEELQSTNEELTTVNDELHSRNQELAQVNSDLVNVLGTVEIPIVIVDRERRIRRYTPSARRIFSVLPSDVGRPLADIRLQIDIRDLDEQLVWVIETVGVKESEVQDQLGHWYRLQIRPYRTTDDGVDGAILSFVDIDALKHLIGDAQKARAEAERANVAKDQFLATVSHELRSPLASMLVYAQLLRQGGLDDAKLRRAGEAIERGTKTQVQLIEDLVDVSRIVASKLKIERRPVDLADVIHAAFEQARAPAERKRVEIVKVLPDAPLDRVLGDATRLQQIVSNLLNNSIKFTPEGGRVTVTLAKVADKARVEVSDTGVGIDREFLPRIFDRFAQEDSSSTRSYGGLGLGLAIVRHLVEIHGGTVRAESPGKGQGTTVAVTLALLPQDAALRPTPGRAPPDLRAPVAGDAPLGHARILVVDDDAATRDAISEMLQHRGARVSVAGSAGEAMAAVEEHRPEVIVCDIAMPGEDGNDFMRRLRSLRIDTPAVALTALAGADDERHALASGFQLHMAKPVDAERLIAAVAALRAGRSGSDAA